MLPGGVKVIGIYVWASELAVKNSTLMLCQVSLSNLSQHVDFIVEVTVSLHWLV